MVHNFQKGPLNTFPGPCRIDVCFVVYSKVTMSCRQQSIRANQNRATQEKAVGRIYEHACEKPIKRKGRFGGWYDAHLLLMLVKYGNWPGAASSPPTMLGVISNCSCRLRVDGSFCCPKTILCDNSNDNSCSRWKKHCWFFMIII